MVHWHHLNKNIMKKLILLILLIAGAGLAWYLASPLLFDDVVDEEFPITTNEESELAQTQDTDEEGIQTLEINGEKINIKEMEAMNEDAQEELAQAIIEQAISQPEKVMNETMPNMKTANEDEKNKEPTLISSGEFQDGDDFHKGSGIATIYQLPDESRLLRFENFEVTNGPDLRVILTKEGNPTEEQVKNGIELEKLKGNKGNQNYDLPADINPNDYQAVVIYCDPFSVIFSTASLN